MEESGHVIVQPLKDGFVIGNLTYRWEVKPAEEVAILSLYWCPFKANQWRHWEWLAVFHSITNNFLALEVGLALGLESHEDIPGVVKEAKGMLVGALHERLGVPN